MTIQSCPVRQPRFNSELHLHIISENTLKTSKRIRHWISYLWIMTCIPAALYVTTEWPWKSQRVGGEGVHKRGGPCHAVCMTRLTSGAKMEFDGVLYYFTIIRGWLMGGIYLDWLLFTEGWLLPNKLSNNQRCRFSSRRVAQHIEVWSLMDFLQSVFGRWWICFLIRSVSVIMAVVLQQKSAFHDTCTYTVWSAPIKWAFFVTRSRRIYLPFFTSTNLS